MSVQVPPESLPVSPAVRAPLQRRLLLGLAAVIAVAASATVSAEQASVSASDDVPRVVLQYDRASLDSNQGVQALYRRIVLAAEEVCPQVVSLDFLSPGVRACRAQAIAQAVRAIGSPRLAALYRQTIGQG